MSIKKEKISPFSCLFFSYLLQVQIDGKRLSTHLDIAASTHINIPAPDQHPRKEFIHHQHSHATKHRSRCPLLSPQPPPRLPPRPPQPAPPSRPLLVPQPPKVPTTSVTGISATPTDSPSATFSSSVAGAEWRRITRTRIPRASRSAPSMEVARSQMGRNICS